VSALRRTTEFPVFLFSGRANIWHQIFSIEKGKERFKITENFQNYNCYKGSSTNDVTVKIDRVLQIFFAIARNPTRDGSSSKTIFFQILTKMLYFGRINSKNGLY
jgi:hypothetical protein